MVGFNYLKSLTCIFFKTEFKINLQFDGDTREKNPDRGERRSFFPQPLDEFQKWSAGLSFEHEASTNGPPFLLSLRISTTCKHERVARGEVLVSWIEVKGHPVTDLAASFHPVTSSSKWQSTSIWQKRLWWISISSSPAVTSASVVPVPCGRRRERTCWRRARHVN